MAQKTGTGFSGGFGAGMGACVGCIALPIALVVGFLMLVANVASHQDPTVANLPPVSPTSPQTAEQMMDDSDRAKAATGERVSVSNTGYEIQEINADGGRAQVWGMFHNNTDRTISRAGATLELYDSDNYNVGTYTLYASDIPPHENQIATGELVITQDGTAPFRTEATDVTVDFR